MTDHLTQFVESSLVSMLKAIQELVWPALFFLAIGFVAKGRTVFVDIRRALSETCLNFQILFFNLVFVAPLIGMGGQALWEAFEQGGLWRIDPGVWSGVPPIVVVFVAVFVGDFVGYWRHRLEHGRLLWPSHAVHHSDTEMTWLTLERFHPVNRVTTFAIDTGALLLLGLPTYAVIANGLVRHFYGYFIHADLPWTYGRFGAVFVSPAMHRWHHSAEPRFFGTNFATVFSVFDRAFGTFDVPGPCTGRLGVSDVMAPTLRGQMGHALSPRAYRGLFGRRTRADGEARQGK